MTKFLALLLVIISSSLATTANATVIGSLSFIEPTGTVSPNEAIEVWLTLSLDENSDPISQSAFYDEDFNVIEDYLPEYGYNKSGELLKFAEFDPWGLILTSLDFSFTCPPNAAECLYSEYERIDEDGISDLFSFTQILAAGESQDYQIYTYIPPLESLAPGKYDFGQLNAEYSMTATGYSENGDYIQAELFKFTTQCDDVVCGFTRTIAVDVPEPSIALAYLSIFVLVFVRSRSKLGLAIRKRA